MIDVCIDMCLSGGRCLCVFLDMRQGTVTNVCADMCTDTRFDRHGLVPGLIGMVGMAVCLRSGRCSVRKSAGPRSAMRGRINRCTRAFYFTHGSERLL